MQRIHLQFLNAKLQGTRIQSTYGWKELGLAQQSRWYSPRICLRASRLWTVTSLSGIFATKFCYQQQLTLPDLSDSYITLLPLWPLRSVCHTVKKRRGPSQGTSCFLCRICQAHMQLLFPQISDVFHTGLLLVFQTWDINVCTHTYIGKLLLFKGSSMFPYTPVKSYAAIPPISLIIFNSLLYTRLKQHTHKGCMWEKSQQVHCTLMQCFEV